MVSRCLIELHYLPCLEYLCGVSRFREVELEAHEFYVKQSYRTRCQINSSQGVLQLTVPVTGKHGKVPVREVKVDYRMKWQNNHWRSIESAYRKAAFFEHYSDDLKNILFHDHEFLFDLNRALLSFCLKSIGIPLTLSESVAYENISSPGKVDLRSLICLKKAFSGRSFYKPTPYTQVFGNKFVPNLSFIDLLFCEGPNAIHIIRSSSGGDLNK